MFDTRADALEFLDGDDLDETLALQSYRFMAVVNKYFGGTAVVQDFITNEARCKGSDEPLRILDIGSGICDIPISLCTWAKAAGLSLEYTCVEPSSYAAQAARRAIVNYPNIRLVQEDIFAYRPATRYDCAVGSLFFHHLSDERITELVARLRMFGCKSILLNDLHRSWGCYMGGAFASAFSPAGVRHDALLSIRKGFKADELRRLLEKIPDAAVVVRTAWFGRIWAAVRFERE